MNGHPVYFYATLFCVCQSKSPSLSFPGSRGSGSTPFRHRDEKPVTATPLDSAFTNRDACNSFRIRFYENCRVSPLFLTENLKFYLKFDLPSRSLCSLLSLLEQRAFHNSFAIKLFRTLSKYSRVWPNSSYSGILPSPPIRPIAGGGLWCHNLRRHETRHRPWETTPLPSVSKIRERTSGTVRRRSRSPRLGRGCGSIAMRSHSQEGLGPSF